jgi:hypothetical protein
MNSNLYNSKNTFQHVRITLTSSKLSINMSFNNMSLLTIPLNTTMSFYSVTIMTIFYIRKGFANKLLSYIKTFNKCHNVSQCTFTKQNNPWKNSEHFIFLKSLHHFFTFILWHPSNITRKKRWTKTHQLFHCAMPMAPGFNLPHNRFSHHQKSYFNHVFSHQFSLKWTLITQVKLVFSLSNHLSQISPLVEDYQIVYLMKLKKKTLNTTKDNFCH